MAGSILIPLKTVFDDKGLKQAQSQFSKLGGSLKGILGAAGLTHSHIFWCCGGLMLLGSLYVGRRTE